MFFMAYFVALVISTWLLRELATIFGVKPLLLIDFRSIGRLDKQAGLHPLKALH